MGVAQAGTAKAGSRSLARDGAGWEGVMATKHVRLPAQATKKTKPLPKKLKAAMDAKLRKFALVYPKCWK
jgi:hypothetical protein